MAARVNSSVNREQAVRSALIDMVASTPVTVIPRPKIAIGAIAIAFGGLVAGASLSAAALEVGEAQPSAGPSVQYALGPIQAFERMRVASDELPADLPDYATSGADRSTSRLVGKAGDSLVFLLEGPAAAPLCLLVWAPSPGEPLWGLGCGGIPQSIELDGIASVRVDKSGIEAPEGWAKLDDNVAAEIVDK